MLSKNKTRSPAYAAHAVGVKKGRIDVRDLGSERRSQL